MNSSSNNFIGDNIKHTLDPRKWGDYEILLDEGLSEIEIENLLLKILESEKNINHQYSGDWEVVSRRKRKELKNSKNNHTNKIKDSGKLKSKEIRKDYYPKNSLKSENLEIKNIQKQKKLNIQKIENFDSDISSSPFKNFKQDRKIQKYSKFTENRKNWKD